jgi:enoyl-CoA hydratase/carnithine racemase
MPFWKIDKYVRKLIGPNPLRAHDAIGAAGANFLTWSCLHHLARNYGEVFAPTAVLLDRKETGQNWYSPDHFRPVVDWSAGEEELAELDAWIFGALVQMTSLVLHEKRSHLAHINAIGEICAQFRPGILAQIRARGVKESVKAVERYHKLHPAARKDAWHPDALARIDTPEGQQLYVNAEHDGKVGVITIGRESYSADVDAEMNRAIDWLKAAGVKSVIVTGDFHLSTQLVGADTSDFYPALTDGDKGVAIARSWSKTARRLHSDFATSVGFISGKRCLGGMMELMMHCHYVVAVEGASLGMPEVTLPVVPGMEGCHWPFRRADAKEWPKLLKLLLGGAPVRAEEAVGWLIDAAAPQDEAIRTAWEIATGSSKVKKRPLEEGRLKSVPKGTSGLAPAGSSLAAAGRKAILDCVQGSCSATLADALEVQARHSGGFMATKSCMKGVIGAAYSKTMLV